MKYIVLLIFISFFSCENKIKTKIKGIIYINKDLPVLNIEIGSKIIFSPMHSKYAKRVGLVLKKTENLNSK